MDPTQTITMLRSWATALERREATLEGCTVINHCRRRTNKTTLATPQSVPPLDDSRWELLLEVRMRGDQKKRG